METAACLPQVLERHKGTRVTLHMHANAGVACQRMLECKELVLLQHAQCNVHVWLLQTLPTVFPKWLPEHGLHIESIIAGYLIADMS